MLSKIILQVRSKTLVYLTIQKLRASSTLISWRIYWWWNEMRSVSRYTTRRLVSGNRMYQRRMLTLVVLLSLQTMSIMEHTSMLLPLPTTTTSSSGITKVMYTKNSSTHQISRCASNGVVETLIDCSLVVLISNFMPSMWKKWKNWQRRRTRETMKILDMGKTKFVIRRLFWTCCPLLIWATSQLPH